MIKEFIVVITLILSLMILCGCVENENKSYLENIIITHHEYNHRDDWLKIKEVTGFIKNNGNETIRTVTVKVSFFNDKDFLLKEKYDFVNNLEPLMEKDFRFEYENYEKYYGDVSYYKVDISDFKLE